MGQYDEFAEQYNDLVADGKMSNAYAYILQYFQSIHPQGKKICDIGCGPGELSSRLSGLGAEVTGVDLSVKLLEYARTRSDQVSWIQDDAMKLDKIPDESFDYAVSSLMLMDVSDHQDVFKAARRILKQDGVMLWVIMHPCFQSPFSHGLGDGSRRIVQYETQFWKSAGVGTIRSTLGAYHRPLSSYLNDFLQAGFTLLRVDEPEREDRAIDVLPSYFAVVGRKL